jgi:tRNA(Arg) A34 adenosine deaminase TadA
MSMRLQDKVRVSVFHLRAGAMQSPMSSPTDPTAPNDPMTRALSLARAAAVRGEVPVGAVVVAAGTGRILAEAHNLVETAPDPTAHAELLALRAAAALRGDPRLPDCDLYVTLEPCAMCATAIAFARIRRVYFGAYDPKGGGVEHGARVFTQPTCHHRPEVVGGLRERACAEVLRTFFREKRD